MPGALGASLSVRYLDNPGGDLAWLKQRWERMKATLGSRREAADGNKVVLNLIYSHAKETSFSITV
jgi:hypothetical protein